MHRWRTAAALTLCIVAAGCGGKTTAAPPPPKASPTPQATVIPADLVAYAQQAQPILKTTVGDVKSLASELGKSHFYDKIAFDCADKAAVLSSSNAALQGLATPRQANGFLSDAIKGYTTALNAADECSTAADARIPHDLGTARQDFSRAATDLARAETGVAAWKPSH